jgi:hypothetical protein
VHPVRDGTQEAQVYSCDDAGAPVASTVLPAG